MIDGTWMRERERERERELRHRVWWWDFQRISLALKKCAITLFVKKPLNSGPYILKFVVDDTRCHPHLRPEIKIMLSFNSMMLRRLSYA